MSTRSKDKRELVSLRKGIAELEAAKADIQCAQDKLQETMERYLNMFKYSPISFWEEDFSEIKMYIDCLQKKGIKDFRAYFKKHPEDIIFLAEKVKIVDVNEATIKLYQAKSVKDFRQGLSHVFNKESYDIFREEVIALSEGKTEFCSEAVTLSLKGEERHILLKLAIAPGCEKNLSKVFVAVIDISSLKRTEEELKESEEKYRKIFETVNDAIFLAEVKTGIILEANKKAEELIGVPVDKIVGLHYTQLYPKEAEDVCRKIFQSHVKSRKSISENIFVRHKSGKKDSRVN